MPPLWERLEAQIDWYDRKATQNQRAYKWSKVAIIVLAISLPILAEYSHIGDFERAPAFLVGLAAGADPLARRVPASQQMAGELDPLPRDLRGLEARHEQHLFFEKACPYDGLKPEEAQRLLAERTGALAMAEHAKWVHARSDKTETTTG